MDGPGLTLKRPGFEVTQPLDQDGFFHFDGFQKLSELSRRDAKLAGMIPAALPQFLARQVDFAFRAAMQNRVAFGNAFDPLPVHERIGGADIERIVTDGNLLASPTLGCGNVPTSNKDD